MNPIRRQPARRAVVMAAAALVALPAACGSGGGSTAAAPPAMAGPPMADASAAVPAAGRETVDIADFKFGPPTIKVAAGGSVAWANGDDAPHTATAPDGAFDTGTIVKGQRKAATFAEPGTYAYICSFHPFMKGTVVVE